MGHPTISAALRAGADVSVTVRLNTDVKRAIATIDSGAWTPIKYPQAIWDDETGRRVSRAEVAEIDFTAFAAQRKSHHVPGRLVVRRIPDVNADKKKIAGQGTLGVPPACGGVDVWRFHAFFPPQVSGRLWRVGPFRAGNTSSTPSDSHASISVLAGGAPTTVPGDELDTVAMDQLHRRHAIIENVHADLKDSALAHMPSGHFAANAAWLVLAVIAFNLTRAAGTLTGRPSLAKATACTLRHTLINVPARIASSARKLALHLPENWPWQHARDALYAATHGPPTATAS